MSEIVTYFNYNHLHSLLCSRFVDKGVFGSVMLVAVSCSCLTQLKRFCVLFCVPDRAFYLSSHNINLSLLPSAYINSVCLAYTYSGHIGLHVHTKPN
jgi:hypothetical protein